MSTPELDWLVQRPNWSESLKYLRDAPEHDVWEELVVLANSRIDMVSTMRLDRRLVTLFGNAPPPDLTTNPVRLAVLGSAVVDHLFSGIRVGALRRGIWATLYKSEYGQYIQALRDPNSGLRAWKPTAILLALDSRHLFGAFKVNEPSAEVDARMDQVMAMLVQSWRIARSEFRCQVLQQTAVPVFPTLFGNNEHRLAGAPANLVVQFNQRLRFLADEEGVTVLAVDDRVAIDGIAGWYDPVLWHRAKQEIHLAAAPVYGDLVGRLLAAQQGRSFKCLVLDLDNTLWGGVIGDDGIDGIVLGQGSALGEAFVGFQHYVRDLSARGVILAVCSKNDEANALEPFEKHFEMVLKRSDIACFSASWQDKATAIRQIAKQLNIGLDSLVFADDNPSEREMVRRELPMVAVPELPQDPALYASIIAQAGYFEALHLTAEDSVRTQQYQENVLRATFKDTATDMPSYLNSLNMKMYWSRFRTIDKQRIVQLINKTNQFNVTTRRYSDEEVAAVIETPLVLSLQIRLVDQFGDNGIVALIIGRVLAVRTEMEIDTWLMSCRVLGRQVERATLNVLVAEATRQRVRRLIGRYRPSAKNGMVKNLFSQLGFTQVVAETDGDLLWELNLQDFVPHPTFVNIIEV